MKIIRKISAAVTAGIISLSCLSLQNFVSVDNPFHVLTTNAAATVWDSSTDTAWYDGEDETMHISTAEEFAGLFRLIEGGITMEGQTIILDKDVYLNELSEMDPDSEETPTNVWSFGSGEFEGTFDGGNHTVYGLYTKTNGFFGTIGTDGAVQNFSVSDTVVKIESSSNATADVYVLCDTNNGIIDNCNVDADVNSVVNRYCCGLLSSNNTGTIQNCSSNGNIYLYTSIEYSGNYIGGMCGKNSGEIRKCENNVIQNYPDDLYGSYQFYNYLYDSYVGGIVGFSNGLISACINNGDISIDRLLISYKTNDGTSGIGGVAGSISGASVESCANNGNIIVKITDWYSGSGDYYSIGGIIGVLKENNNSNINVKCVNCINNGNISGSGSIYYCYSNTGGIIGRAESVDIIQCGNNGKISGDCAGGIIGLAALGTETETNNIYCKYVYNKGDVSGEYAGGIYGKYNANKDKTNKSTTICEDSYNTGSITETSSAGGLLGYLYKGEYYHLTVQNFYSAASEVSGSTNSGTLIGKSDYLNFTFINSYYLNSGASQSVGNLTGEYGTAKSGANMKKEAFAESLGGAFVYVEENYPMLFWEVGVPMLNIDKSELSFVELYEQSTITAETTYEGDLIWSSSDESVAQVDENGVVTAVGNGTCTITVQAESVKKSCNVQVDYSYYLKETGVSMKVDASQTLAVYSKNTEERTDLEVTYYSTNEDVAEVNSRGVISANAPGKAEIHAVIGGMDLVCKVTVLTVRGDVNADNQFTIADVVAMQKWILNVPGAKLNYWQAGDLYQDDEINVFDLVIMKSELL